MDPTALQRRKSLGKTRSKKQILEEHSAKYAIIRSQRYSKARKGRSLFCNQPTHLWGLESNFHVHKQGMNPRDWHIPPYFMAAAWAIAYHLHNFRKFLTVYTLSVMAASLCCTMICSHTGFDVNLNPMLILSAVIFPLSFSINASFARREFALSALATQFASSMALLFVHRDWSKFDGLGKPFVQRTYDAISRIFKRQAEYLYQLDESTKLDLLGDLYANFSELSKQNDECRSAGVPPPMITQPYSRVFDMIACLEKLRIISDYRTPSSMRTYNTLFITILPIVLSPYFASIEKTQFLVGYIACCVVSFMFAALITVQRMMENPFHSKEDDINLYSPLHLCEVLRLIVADFLEKPPEVGQIKIPDEV